MFELELLKYSKAHFIIHVMLLKSASENAKLAKIMNIKKYENLQKKVVCLEEKTEFCRFFE